MKNIYKILITIFIALLILLISIPFLFQDKIITLVKKTVNNNITAQLNFSEADLSLFRDFPNASVRLSNVSIINKEPFDGDTLLFAKEINLDLKLTELLKKATEKLTIQSFSIEDATVNVLVNQAGIANYDIAKPTKNTPENTEINNQENQATSNFGLAINSYAIKNTLIKYHDKKSKLKLILTDFNHHGKGDFSEAISELNTQTTTNISFEMDGNSYAKNQKIALDALLKIDLVNSKFSFLENEAKLNELPLIFDGYIQLNEKNQEVALSFKTPSSDFKNFLGLVPKSYTKSIENVKTSGNFSISGTVKGLVTDTKIPLLDISVKAENASFKYPDLPKSVRNITMDMRLKNTSGIIDDTFITINGLSFKIDEDIFSGSGTAYNITKNPKIDAKLKGTLNLANLHKAYPISLENELQGILKADLHTQFDVNAIQNNVVNRIKNNGHIEVDNLVFSSDEMIHPIHIKSTKINFTPTVVTLENFDATTGKSDIKATGELQNLVGFVLADKNLQGNFKLNSNAFYLNDFMQETATENSKKEQDKNQETTTASLKIPAFLDCKILANANTVYYDNLTLKKVTGILLIKNQKATLQDVNAQLFKGNISFNGTVNTQEKTPSFNMDLGIKSFDIAESFNGLELLKAISPIAGAMTGNLNSTINLSGVLNNDFTPDLASLSGKALAELLNTKINPEKTKALSLLSNKISFIDMNKLNLKDLKTQVSFEKGQVVVKPFQLKYNDIDINVGGSHSFDQNMNYNITLNVPAKYLGSETQGLLAKLSEKDQNMTIPITANITGNMKNPSVKTDMASSVKNLSQKLIEQQKENLINKALGKISGNQTTNQATNSVNNTVKSTVNTIGNLLGTKKTDSTKTNTTKTEKTTETVKKVTDVLGGLFGKKKKKEDEK
ncbi:AsmA-like C-terminal region-containing protein [Tenacibaculum piscium]|uniref:AsmA-like C-terminal region-containing protein n=1 Tax=Tenacibaculum piscium TaxID=1458515 RepID=UPI001F1EAE18|nr:AsmA-like C-terminal region-containing protein [Tenacibaculum piscium]